MALDLILETAALLAGGSQSKGFVRAVKRVWLIAVATIAIGAITTCIVGSLGGYLEAPADTKAVLVWALIVMVTATVAAGLLASVGSVLLCKGGSGGR